MLGCPIRYLAEIVDKVSNKCGLFARYYVLQLTRETENKSTTRSALPREPCVRACSFRVQGGIPPKPRWMQIVILKIGATVTETAGAWAYSQDVELLAVVSCPIAWTQCATMDASRNQASHQLTAVDASRIGCFGKGTPISWLRWMLPAPDAPGTGRHQDWQPCMPLEPSALGIGHHLEEWKCAPMQASMTRPTNNMSPDNQQNLIML